ncbi:aminoglycoside phosphotransferase family protein [Microbacterium sp. NPDC028030]|uniref:aminoglycoside phosphotransferase family protein n=1 Tax=Microbacterium sp. NPDC028030 TaxID=3155124 RepID=UPI0034079073
MNAGADRLRPEWSALPLLLRARVVDAIGGRFVRDAPAQSGFSAAYAGVVTTTRGTAFVKACAHDGHADSLAFLRAEMQVLTVLPSEIAPTVLRAVDEPVGAALVLAALDGRHPGSPWVADDLHAIAESLRVLASTSAPVGMPDAVDALVPGFTRWRDITEDEALFHALPDGLQARISELLRIEHGFGDAVSGGVIVHGDVRADNILVHDGRAHLLDWPHALRGAPWVDLPCLLPSIEASGGPSCEDAWPVFEQHGAPPAADMIAVISGFASFLWYAQAQPDIPQLPGLRAFQRAQALPALRWLDVLLTQAQVRAESR